MKIELKYSILISAIFIFLLSVFFYISYFFFSNDLLDEVLNEYKDSVSNLAFLMSRLTEDEMLNDELKENKFYNMFADEKGYYFILDEKGTQIFHTDKSDIGKNIVDDLGFNDFWNYIKTNKEGTNEYTYKNKKRYAAFSTFNLKDKEYIIVHAIEKSKIFLDTHKLKNNLIIIFIVFVIFIFVSSYIISKLIGKAFKKQIKTIEEFTNNVSSNIAESSSAASEIESVANNTQKNIEKLDELIQNFSSSIEEGRSELNATLLNMKEFFDNIQNMNQKTLKIADFINKLSSLNDKIKDLADTVSILSINSSIETSKENIDKEGLSKIADLINELSTEARNTSKNSDNVLKEIENSITSNVLLSEKVSKELINVENSLDSISQVVESFADNVDTLTGFSHSTRISMNEALDGIKQTSESLVEIKNNLYKLLSLTKIDEN